MPPKKNDPPQVPPAPILVVDTATATASSSGPPKTTQEQRAEPKPYEAGYADGYAHGYADGVAEAGPAPSLFERAKAFALENPGLSEATILNEIANLAAETGEVIRRSDIDLIVAARRRLNVVRKAHAEAQGTIGRPKTPLPSSARSETEYDHVS